MTKMKKQHMFIFDLDGTLYQFDKGKGSTFVNSQFYKDLKKNIHTFIMERRDLNRKDALHEYQRIDSFYNGEVSLGVRMEYEIDQYEYFSNTWNLNPKKYIAKDKQLQKMFTLISGKAVLLTAAPRVWAISALTYLRLEDAFGKRIYTGEPILRKPNPEIFLSIANDLGIEPSQVFSIGDQEESDILPAKSIGMKTIHIGKGNTSADYQTNTAKDAIVLLQKEGYL